MSVLGIVGAAAGYFITGTPQGAMLGYSLGSGVDALVNAPTVEGPRLEDLKVQMSAYGAAIPHEWGMNRHAGVVIWPKNLELKESSHTESAKGGPESTTYSYSCSVAVLLCEGPIKGVRRIWANKRIVYDASAENEGPTKDPAVHGLRFYLGTEDQEVDPLIEATDGPSPAYLGYAYVVFEDFELADYANRPPQFEFEIITEGEQAPDVPPERFGTFVPPFNGPGTSVLDPANGYLWVLNGVTASTAAQTGGAQDGPCINVYDLATKELVTIISEGKSSGSFFGAPLYNRAYGDLAYNPDRQSVFAGSNTSASTHAWYEFSADTFAQVKIGEAGQGIGYGAGVPSGVAYVSGALMLSLKEGFFGGNLTYFNPDSGPFMNLSSPRNIGSPGRAITLADHRVAVPAAGGLLIVTPSGFESIWYDGETLLPGSTGTDLAGAALAFDSARNRLLWAFGGRLVALDVSDSSGAEAIAGVMTLPSGAGFNAIVSDPRNGMVYGIGQGSGYVIDGETLTLDRTVSTSAILLPTDLALSPVPGEIIITGFDGVWSMTLDAGLAPAQIPLSKIVGDICTMKEGLAPAQIDVAALTPLVDGYPLSRQMTRRAAIEALQPIYNFDAVENDDKIQFVMRGGGVAAVIPEEDRAAREYGADLPDSLTIVRAQDLELPFEVELEYPDVDADHLIGAQYSRRITKDTKQKVNLQTAVVMNAEKAKSVTAVNLYEAWLQTTFRWTTTRKYSHLLPTDVVELPTKEANYRARITMKREQPNGIIEWEGKQEAADVYTQSGAGAAPTNYVKQSVYSPEGTTLELLDTPILRDADDNAGFYAVVGGGGPLPSSSTPTPTAPPGSTPPASTIPPLVLEPFHYAITGTVTSTGAFSGTLTASGKGSFGGPFQGDISSTAGAGSGTFIGTAVNGADGRTSTLTGTVVGAVSGPVSGIAYPYTMPISGTPAVVAGTGPTFGGAICWDGSRFIARPLLNRITAIGGPLWTSADGLHFTQLPSNDLAALIDTLFYGNGVYLANRSTDGKIYRSTNLTNWTESTFDPLPSGYPYGLGQPYARFIQAEGRLVGLGDRGVVVSSTDGANFAIHCNVTTPVDTSGNFTGKGVDMYGMAYGAGKYVAVGATAGDGRLYHAAALAGPFTEIIFDQVSLLDVQFLSDGYFYACGSKRVYPVSGNSYYVSGGYILRSQNGVNWTDVTPPPQLAITQFKGSYGSRIYELGGLKVIIGDNCDYTSTNGVNWTERPRLVYHVMDGASNGSVIALREYDWTDDPITGTTTYNAKPVLFNGAGFTPDLSAPYVP
jgi:hypothetical protein